MVSGQQLGVRLFISRKMMRKQRYEGETAVFCLDFVTFEIGFELVRFKE